MQTIMKLEDVKLTIKKMEREGKECFVTDGKLSEEALKWLRSQKYLIKVVGELTASAKTDEALPTEKEFEELRKEKERREDEAKALRGLIELLTITAILDEMM